VAHHLVFRIRTSCPNSLGNLVLLLLSLEHLQEARELEYYAEVEIVFLESVWTSLLCFTFAGNLLEVVAGQRGIKIRESEAQFGCGVRYTNLPAEARSISFMIGPRIGAS
jgi:hypothetical protein